MHSIYCVSMQYVVCSITFQKQPLLLLDPGGSRSAVLCLMAAGGQRRASLMCLLAAAGQQRAAVYWEDWARKRRESWFIAGVSCK